MRDLTGLHDELAAALRKLDDRQTDELRDLRRTQAALEQVIEILVGKGVLGEGHRRLIEKVADKAGEAVRPRVRLRQYVDKYALEGADIDCASLVHLCHARCCSFSFELTTQDLDEGAVRWEIDQPYVIRHEADGQCTHLDRAGAGCTIHAKRPAVCRTYDCRQDRRVWIDFDQRIAAP